MKVKQPKASNHKTEVVTSQEEMDRENEGVPMDRGWSWVIAIISFLDMFVVVGYTRSLSVLFVDIVQAFEETNTVISLMFTVHSLAGSISSVMISNIVMKRFDVRTITVFCAMINGVASILVSFAPNIVIFLLLFIVKGVAFGGLILCPLSMIGFYFNKRRAMASSLGSAGFCVAYIAFPPLTEILRLEIGFRGTLLILSGVELHLVAVNMLLRPVESYKKRYHFKLRQQEKAAKQNRTPIYKGPNHDVNSDPNPFLITSGDVYNTKGEGQDEDVSLVEDPCPDEANEDKYDGIGSKDDDPSFKEVLIHEDTENTQIKTSRQRSCSDAEQIKNGFTSGGLSPTLFSSQRNVIVPSRQMSCDSSTVASSRKQISLERYTSQLSVVSHADLPCILPSLAEESEKSGRGCQLSTFIDLSLFKNWLFRMMMLFTALAVFSNYLTIYMPTIAVTSGIGKSDAAMLMTVSGVTDLVTRIVMGFIADFKFVSKPKLVAFSLAVITVICQCSRLFNTYKLFVAFAVLVGIFGGFRQNFYNVMLLDYFGAENIAKANGLAMMIATLVISLNHPVLGAMLDATGSFVIPLHYVGVMVMLSTIVILMEPLFKKLNDKKFMKENNVLSKEGELKGDKEETEPLQKTELEV